jgi:integrase
MRRGELLGLQWADVDLAGRWLSVRRSRGARGMGDVKGGHGRQVRLTEAAVDALGAISGGDGQVFTTSVGTPPIPRNVPRAFEAPLTRANMPRIRFHDMRHTAATLLLKRGVHPKMVADLLGHTSVTVTLNAYSHVTAGMHAQAAFEMDAVLVPTPLAKERRQAEPESLRFLKTESRNPLRTTALNWRR